MKTIGNQGKRKGMRGSVGTGVKNFGDNYLCCVERKGGATSEKRRREEGEKLTGRVHFRQQGAWVSCSVRFLRQSSRWLAAASSHSPGSPSVQVT